MRRVFAIIIALLLATSAHAQSLGVTFDFDGVDQPWPITSQYAPFLPHNIRATNLPGGPASTSIANNATDVAFIAPRAGWVQFSGQVWVVLDWAAAAPNNGYAVLRVFKNGPPGVCADGGSPPLLAGIGIAGSGFWWAYPIPVSGGDYAKAGDSYSFCLYVVSNGQNNYIEANPAHTHITIIELP
jgi:hypothetical protein